MLRRHVPRRIFAPIAALMVLVVGFRSAYATYRCENDGVARSECCCPKADVRAEVDERDDSNTTVDNRCCCDVEIIELGTAPDVRVADDGAPLHHAVPVQPRFEPPAVMHARDLTVAWIHILPAAGPPLRIIKQSFLL